MVFAIPAESARNNDTPKHSETHWLPDNLNLLILGNLVEGHSTLRPSFSSVHVLPGQAREHPRRDFVEYAIQFVCIRRIEVVSTVPLALQRIV